MAKVVAVGGGVGGLSTAIALQRAGIETVVLERLDDVERAQLGARLTLAYNATRAFDAIGLKEKLREAGTLYVDSEFRTASGERLARWSVPSTELQVGIARQALHRVLLDALEPGTLRSGAQCNGFGQDAGGVSVFTNNGDVECDVLVGADGLNGRVGLTLRGHAEPRDAGYKVWRALV